MSAGSATRPYSGTKGDISRRAAWGNWKSASAPPDFDIVCCDPRRPVVLSAEVSLRGRCKQADLKGMILRQVYRSAESCLIALSGSESRAVQSKIESGDVAGLTRCVLADSPDYDAPLAELKTRTFPLSEAIEPLASGVAVG